MKILILLITFLILFSCGFENDYDFRNYCRDQHPYSEVKDIDISCGDHHCIVKDTLKGEIYLYSTNADGGTESQLIYSYKP